MDLRGARIVVANWRDLDHALAGGAERLRLGAGARPGGAGARVEFLTARGHGQARSELRDGIRIVRRGGQLSYYLFGALWVLLRRRSLDAVVDMEAGIPLFAPGRLASTHRT